MAKSHTNSPVLSRHIAKTFAMHIVAVLLGLLVVLQLMDVIGESNRILSVAGASEGDLWTYALLRVPALATQFLPFSVLLASLITFATLAASSQVVIMRSTGLSPHQILMPMLLVGAVCAVMHLVWNETVTVRTAARLAAWQATGYGARPEDSALAQETWTMAGEEIIRAQPTMAADGGVLLQNVAIFRRSGLGGVTMVTLADQGRVSPSGEGVLENIRVIDLGTHESRTAAREAWRPGLAPAGFFSRSPDPKLVDFFDLWAAAQVLKAAGKDSFSLRSELYHKLARPLASLLMPLLGAVAAFGLARAGNVLARAGIGLALGFTYFVVENFIMAMGRSGSLPPSIAAWLPALLFLVVSEAVLFRTEQ